MRGRGMRVETLRYFLAIAECGSYSLASRRLYVSQQGLGKSIRAFERDLGVPLFEKTGRKVHLTEAGKRLVPLAQDYLALDRDIRDAMRKLAPDRPEEAVTLWTTSFTSSVVFNYMKSDLESWGLRHAVLVERDRADVLQALRSPAGPCRLALVALPSDEAAALAADPALDFEPLISADLGVIGTSALLSPRLRGIAAADVAQLPIASYSERMLDDLVARLFAAIPLRNEIQHTTNLPMIEELVAAGRAVTFWDSFSAFLGAETDPRIFVPIKDGPSFIVGAADNPAKLDDGERRYLRQLAACITTTCAPYRARHPLP
ncbi:LysR family transcriptional regulator [Adlercreutzia faecimuris]|uniref:LysR family transcriptional regulator n=1 Tax=Adlercreutzia faecimuris TaxID=2897341 RepID=A0ABS9WEY6_9ACTN|nr:LysR family transcriptional regulator [Adlercreutzia sp. JBNU-10]MCI2241420.1 LysR family transcriptional regulator [Adlercreutzia sp. JBNU-10]